MNTQLFTYDTKPIKGIVVNQLVALPEQCRVIESVKTSSDHFFKLIVELDYAISKDTSPSYQADQGFDATVKLALKPGQVSLNNEIFAHGKVDFKIIRTDSSLHLIYGDEKGISIDIVDEELSVGDVLDMLRHAFLGLQVHICQSVFKDKQIISDKLKGQLASVDELMDLVSSTQQLRALENVNSRNFHEEDY